MIFHFDTEDPHAAVAALCVYVVWRSRDRGKFKIDPEVWGRVERFVKDCSKRATKISEFLEALKSPRRIYAPSLHPKFWNLGLNGTVIDGDEVYADEPARQFGSQVVERADQRAVLKLLHRETAYVVMLVRERLEREKPIEGRYDALSLETVAEGA